MVQIPFDVIIEKIREKKGLSVDEINDRIKSKLEQLSGLVSREGAANIVANELGVKLIENSGKLKDMFPGMRNAEFFVKVQKIFDTRSFSRKDGSEGKVATVVIADETKDMRLVFWGDKADLVAKFNEGDILKVSGALIKENQSKVEAHVNDNTTLDVNPEGVAIEGVVAFSSSPIERKQMKDLVDNAFNVEVLATIVQVFDPKFFEVCPHCSKRVRELDEGFVCEEHKVVVPSINVVLTLVGDDGSENMRLVFFGDLASTVLNKSKDEVLAFKNDLSSFEPLKTELLGEQFKIVGRSRKNAFFDRVELIASSVSKADPQEELERLKGE